MGGLCDFNPFFSGINLCDRVPSINKGKQIDINIDHLTKYNLFGQTHRNSPKLSPFDNN